MNACSLKKHLRNTAGMLLAALWLSHCAAASEEQVAVVIAGINYTDRTLAGFVFKDFGAAIPAQAWKIPAYQSSGITCCFLLPRQWRPGIHVELLYRWDDDDHATYDPFQAPEDSGPASVRVELPPYEGEPVTLWALFHPDGEIEVLASAVAPGHPQWAGREPLWPALSHDSRQRAWEEKIAALKAGEKYYMDLVSEPSPQSLRLLWKVSEEHEPESIASFTGADDPRFIEYYIELSKDWLSNVQQQLRLLEASRP